MIYLHHKTIYK